MSDFLIKQYEKFYKQFLFDWYAGCALTGAVMGSIVSKQEIKDAKLSEIKQIAKVMVGEKDLSKLN